MTGFSISMDRIPKESLIQAECNDIPNEKRLAFFMQEVTGRALVMMESATGQQDIAMDLVQESFISLYKSYANKTTNEWYPLFYTILNNKLQDFRRKEQRSFKNFSFFKKKETIDDDDELEIVDEYNLDPSDILTHHLTLEEIQTAIQQLPARQQQAFTLRAWEGFSTQTTAEIMNCTEGSVKTHYHRAIQNLKAALSHLNPTAGEFSDES
ncbi:RNA polymerase sigma factor [Acinetobacter apis]|uniref:RNA polymerase sigma-70 factor, ECF subfamily n=1 Tax=Acinetobacter apis TaxID=1229165 RepID=A0A217EEP4_9GAMM|nr:RNA polymerase sigma factor [Acinetobacter apis]SNQ28943.1 RNA polymerase sigma-70 factor, ECF subfamily [Acinetobacter apis]